MGTMVIKKIGALILAVLIIWLGFWFWNHRRHNTSDDRVVLQTTIDARDRVIKQLGDSLGRQQKVEAKTDTLWREGDVRWRNRPASPSRSIDTSDVTQLQHEIRDLRQKVEVDSEAGDNLERTCTDRISSCDATKRLLMSALDSVRRQARDFRKLANTPQPRRRCGLGGTIGYGMVYSNEKFPTGPGGAAGITCSF